MTQKTDNTDHPSVGLWEGHSTRARYTASYCSRMEAALDREWEHHARHNQFQAGINSLGQEEGRRTGL